MLIMRLRFGRPLTMQAYKVEFMSAIEGAPRAAIKRLTRDIEAELVAATVNAPDWYALLFYGYRAAAANMFVRDTLYAARMARDLLWEDHKSINLDEFVIISQ